MITWTNLYEKGEQRPVVDSSDGFITHIDKFFYYNNNLYYPTEEQGYNPDEDIYFRKFQGVFQVGVDNESV